MILDADDKDVVDTLPVLRRRRAFQRVFSQVTPDCSPMKGKEIWFETKERTAVKRGTDKAIGSLAREVSQVGISAVLTRDGYRYYYSTLSPSEYLPPLAAVYAAMFYLGSITRYKPYDFDKIVSRDLSWLISEFLRTQSIQFLYGMAAVIAGVDVVRPYAAVD